MPTQNTAKENRSSNVAATTSAISRLKQGIDWMVRSSESQAQVNAVLDRNGTSLGSLGSSDVQDPESLIPLRTSLRSQAGGYGTFDQSPS